MFDAEQLATSFLNSIDEDMALPLEEEFAHLFLDAVDTDMCKVVGRKWYILLIPLDF